MEVLQEDKLKLRKFLLGSLDARETEELSVQIIGDDRFEVELSIAENLLMEDFLEKNLSPADEKLFYENFLDCEERKEALQEIFLIKQYAKKNYRAKDLFDSNSLETKGFLAKLKDIFTFKQGWAIPAMTVLAIALALGLAWQILSGNKLSEQSPLEKEFAVLNQKELNDVSQISNAETVSLIEGTFRNTNAGNKLKIEKLSDKVFFRLALPFEADTNLPLKMELRQDQKVVFTQTQIRIYKNQSGQEARAFLPKTILQKGQYQIFLENPKDKNSPLIYGFAVE